MLRYSWWLYGLLRFVSFLYDEKSFYRLSTYGVYVPALHDGTGLPFSQWQARLLELLEDVQYGHATVLHANGKIWVLPNVHATNADASTKVHRDSNIRDGDEKPILPIPNDATTTNVLKPSNLPCSSTTNPNPKSNASLNPSFSSFYSITVKTQTSIPSSVKPNWSKTTYQLTCTQSTECQITEFCSWCLIELKT